uniref:Protein Wnt n=1 Tax=Elaeophora elaphi TaxID=1147741 RepID=A0A0R3RTF2_9BILA
MCRRISDLMPVIIRASQTTVTTCQKVFADRRWNCSSILRAPQYKSDLTKVKLILTNPFSGTKEQAFVYALSSAALTHHVAKACVSGDLPYCPCGLNSPTASADASYKWKGCSDNVLYGQKVSREWADASWRKKWRPANVTFPRRQRYRELLDNWAYINSDFSERKLTTDLPPRARMNEHNNEVGRQVTQESLYRKCKCHGVSSSCTVRTCWNTLPDVYEIALKLRERYAEASPLSELMAQSEYVDKAMHGELSRQHLVYLRNSPDYCVADNRTGSYGTTMRLRNSFSILQFEKHERISLRSYRECNLTSSGPNGCSSLCCGRGYYTKQMLVEEQCQCKYVHCCYVKCKTCKYLVDKHFCK